MDCTDPEEIHIREVCMKNALARSQKTMWLKTPLCEQRQDLERSKTSNSYVYRNSVNSERGGRNVEDVNPLSYKRVGDDGDTTTFGTSCGINDPEYWAWGFR
ncbi:hypothetical protein YC2023_010679 [Brassica napus]